MDVTADSKILRLQDNLLLIRKAGGWTAEEFGRFLGLTKQTIRNLEKGETKMSKVQYIAIRSVLDYEIQNNEDKQLVSHILKLLVDSDDVDEEELPEVRKAALIASTAKENDTSGKENDSLFLAVLAAVGLGGIAALLTSSSGSGWLTAIMETATRMAKK